jgi:asparagine synthase (glutamine-hydrolysing)
MCGIAGIIDPRIAPADREAVTSRMCAAMVHRGPDDGGFATQGPATLGMRRLAIFDPANGRQPMVSPDGRWTLVFNGAIYNFATLRRELADGGHWSFRTNCDTEVLLAAFARWGEDCLPKLRGMFAFAVWDRDEQSLFLARDPFGIKPLYYRQDGARLLFGSELNALLASGLSPATIDPRAVTDYLGWLAVPAPRTIYAETLSLCPGERARFRAGRLELRTYWCFRGMPAAAARCRTRAQFIAELRARLEDTIRAHLLADVPVGAFLSGGLDSAAVVGLMARASGARLRTFSIDFAESAYSEAKAAESTARHFGTLHSTITLSGATLARDLPEIVRSLDQPTGDGLNTYYASQAARAGGVTVALSGLGGDELFGGYPSFAQTPRLARWLPAWRALPSRLRAPIVRRLQRGDTRRRKLADVLQHARTANDIGALQRRVFSDPAIAGLLTAETHAAVAAHPPLHPAVDTLAADLDPAQVLELVSAWELRTYMADVLLRDSDAMSMRHSLELRVPLVDRPLIEWLWRQPAEFKFDRDRPKSALREALGDLLPSDVAQRRKQGFSLPMTEWMKGDLRPFLEETFSSASIGRRGLFTPAAVQAAWHGFLSHDDPREWSRVWSLAVLIAFTNRPAPPVGNVASAAAVAVASPSPATPPARRAAPLAPARRTGGTLLLAPEIFSSEGGIPRILCTYLKALCNLAAPSGFVRLLALNDPSISPADRATYGGDRLTAVSACHRNKSRFILETLRLARGCDTLVCGHVFMLPAAWLARRFNPRLRYFLVAHGIEVWREFTLPERVALRGAERILCVSDYTRRELLQRCALPAGRAVVLPNALDPTFRIASGRPLAECDPIILVVTRLTYADRYKGVEHMIAALPAIIAAEPAARLRLIGRGDDIPRLQGIAAQLGVGAAVDFLGFVDDTRLTAELRACRLFALPSRKEGFGLVFLEAMAHGRPCLGARAGGVPEVISSESGVLVEYGDIAGIARAALEALRRTWDEAAILARAAEFSHSHFEARLAELLPA